MNLINSVKIKRTFHVFYASKNTRMEVKMKKMKTLKKNYEFQNVLKRGKFFVGKQIIVYIEKNREEENIFGIAISKKLCTAVKRNSIKRKIRENYRLLQKDLKKGYNIVFLWNKKVPVENLDYHIIENDMKMIFKKAGILI